MTPGRDLDALVAEKVMGLTVGHITVGTQKALIPYELQRGTLLPEFSTDMVAAWAVVEKLIDQVDAEGCRIFDFKLEIGGMWFACFTRTGGPRLRYYRSKSDSAPHAICLAALKAVGA